MLAGSLFVTTLICAWAMNSPTFKNMFVNVPAIIILSILLLVVSLAIGFCYQRVRQYALPLFAVFVVVESLFVGIICSQTNPSVVLTAAAITTVIVLALTAYACNNVSYFRLYQEWPDWLWALPSSHLHRGAGDGHRNDLLEKSDRLSDLLRTNSPPILCILSLRHPTSAGPIWELLLPGWRLHGSPTAVHRHHPNFHPAHPHPGHAAKQLIICQIMHK